MCSIFLEETLRLWRTSIMLEAGRFIWTPLDSCRSWVESRNACMKMESLFFLVFFSFSLFLLLCGVRGTSELKSLNWRNTLSTIIILPKIPNQMRIWGDYRTYHFITSYSMPFQPYFHFHASFVYEALVNWWIRSKPDWIQFHGKKHIKTSNSVIKFQLPVEWDAYMFSSEFQLMFSRSKSTQCNTDEEIIRLKDVHSERGHKTVRSRDIFNPSSSLNFPGFQNLVRES